MWGLNIYLINFFHWIPYIIVAHLCLVEKPFDVVLYIESIVKGNK